MEEFVHHPETAPSEWEPLRPCLDEAMAERTEKLVPNPFLEKSE